MSQNAVDLKELDAHYLGGLFNEFRYGPRDQYVERKNDLAIVHYERRYLSLLQYRLNNPEGVTNRLRLYTNRMVPYLVEIAHYNNTENYISNIVTLLIDIFHLEYKNLQFIKTITQNENKLREFLELTDLPPPLYVHFFQTANNESTTGGSSNKVTFTNRNNESGANILWKFLHYLSFLCDGNSRRIEQLCVILNELYLFLRCGSCFNNYIDHKMFTSIIIPLLSYKVPVSILYHVHNYINANVYMSLRKSFLPSQFSEEYDVTILQISTVRLDKISFKIE